MIGKSGHLHLQPKRFLSRQKHTPQHIIILSKNDEWLNLKQAFYMLAHILYLKK